MSNYAGIDYSGPGSTANRDVATGIRYGVVSQNSINPDVMSDIWSEARDLSYEAAVEEMKKNLESAFANDSDEDRRSDFWAVVKNNFGMRNIEELVDDLMDAQEASELWDVVSDRFGDTYEDNGDRSWLWEKDGYELSNCLVSDVFVSKSPYFTYAPFCSPCVPGAGNLDSARKIEREYQEDVATPGDGLVVPVEDRGVKTFCLDKSFFDDEVCPYPYWDVATGNKIQ